MVTTAPENAEGSEKLSNFPRVTQEEQVWTRCHPAASLWPLDRLSTSAQALPASPGSAPAHQALPSALLLVWLLWGQRARRLSVCISVSTPDFG